ncbi:ferredoxin--NADP reductase [Paracnuella aquatica]|uniref:ferredoxin--NADP reductase n=1 Tax=Paracnuella aquatica TaxID=2268757 RepID=UPI000DEFC07C|nr:FAD-binding oxidoreductase [Paracnuella aquatica]RPD48833.1 oxidoreductase [Paracnuella aquatica]
MALQPWRTGIITRIEQETPNTRRFWIQIPELDRFDFLPGQFISLDLPIHEKPHKRVRSYSIASAPDGTNTVELVIVKLDGGAGSTYLFEAGKIGLEMPVRGPLGVFTLPQNMEQDLYFICTGTGIAPFRSMLHYINEHNVPHRNINLIFGTRTKEDLLYFEEMQSLAQKIPQFQYFPTLSREQWDGCCGYVHTIYERLVLEQKEATGELPPASFFLCGWKNMVDEAKQKILALGYDKKSVHLELYG